MRLSDDSRAILAEQEADAREWSDADFRASYEAWLDGLPAGFPEPELAAAPGADGGGGTAEFPF